MTHVVSERSANEFELVSDAGKNALAPVSAAMRRSIRSPLNETPATPPMPMT